MENVVVASFDPTIFSSNPLSDTQSFSTIRWKNVILDYPRLCTAHLSLKLPIVLTTAANIRKREKAGCFPRLEAIYYDAFTRQFHVPIHCPKSKEVTKIFNEIINKTSTDEEIVRFFTRCANIAKQNLRRKNEHKHMPKAQPIDMLDGVDLDKFNLELPGPTFEKLTLLTADVASRESEETHFIRSTPIPPPPSSPTPSADSEDSHVDRSDELDPKQRRMLNRACLYAYMASILDKDDSSDSD